jgi:hypothetical protein
VSASNDDWKAIASIAAIVLAITVPVSYCTVQRERNKYELQHLCAETKGQLVRGLGTM